MFVFGPRPLPFLRIAAVLAAIFLPLSPRMVVAQIRDGGIDPWNLGKGDWIYSVSDATNRLGGHVTSVTNENSLFLYYKSIGVRYVIVKTGTAATLYNGCYSFPQLSTNLIAKAHANGIWVFGYNRNFGSNVLGEVAIANFAFNQGADGFVFDAEAEFESAALGANGPSLAWQQLSQVRSNWPNKFLAHAPFPIIYFHSSFPYKEFGYWCDAVMPQIYHFSTSGIKESPSAAINWSDVNWRTWQDSLYALPATNINGLTVYWTNAIKPIIPLQDVYGLTFSTNLPCNGPASEVYPDSHVTEFIDFASADPNAQTAGGYQGVNFWRADLHGAGQFANIKAGSAGSFTGVVNNLVLDDARATVSGAWNHVRVFAATTTLPSYYGATGSDTNSFGTNYFSKGQGGGTAYMQFRPRILVAGDYDVFQWHPFVANASSGTPFEINHGSGTTVIYANQQTNAGNWSLLGRFTFAAGTNSTIRVRDDFADAGNLAIVDGLKLVFVATNAPTAPVISQHPTNQSAISGQGVSFTVTATGSAPLSYQWRFNGLPISSATNSTCLLPNSQTNQAGNYSVVITNFLGAVTSAVATLAVNYSLVAATVGGGVIAPTPNPDGYAPGTVVQLTASPNSGFAFSGWTGDESGTANPLAVTLATNKTVTAVFLSTNVDLFLDNTNSEVTFVGAWTSGNTSADKYLADYRFAGTAVGGSLTATYRPAIGNAGYYNVYVWFPQGSNRATNSPWAIVYLGGVTNVFVDQTINGGAWRMIAASLPFAAGTNGLVRLSNDTGYSGKVVLADGVRFSWVAPLNTAPSIALHPQSQIVKVGSNVVFSVSATGTPAPAYQWRFSGTNLPGATANSLARSNVQAADAGIYSVLVSNVAGSILSSNAILTVNPWLPVVFQSIQALPGGGMQLVITGNAGENLWIDRATNLPPAWQPLTNFFNPTSTVQFTDSAATNHPASIYRARQ